MRRSSYILTIIESTIEGVCYGNCAIPFENRKQRLKGNSEFLERKQITFAVSNAMKSRFLFFSLLPYYLRKFLERERERDAKYIFMTQYITSIGLDHCSQINAAVGVQEKRSRSLKRASVESLERESAGHKIAGYSAM